MSGMKVASKRKLIRVGEFDISLEQLTPGEYAETDEEREFSELLAMVREGERAAVMVELCQIHDRAREKEKAAGHYQDGSGSAAS